MRKRSKKHIYLPPALAIYASVMAYIGYPRYKAMGNMKEFWIIYGASLLLAVFLYFILSNREKKRDRFRNND